MNQKHSIENSIFIKIFTLAILKAIRGRKYPYEEKQIINTELIPSLSVKLSERVKYEDLREIIPQPAQKKFTFSVDGLNNNQIKQIPISRKPFLIQRKIPENFRVNLEFGRITLLINDPSIQLIECSGPGKNITIIRQGRKQLTKISLSSNEIKEILEKFAEKARVPLIEGVFRAVVDNFLVNAVISDSIGSRFIIKKTIPQYSL